jgi:hypothetical protein
MSVDWRLGFVRRGLLDLAECSLTVDRAAMFFELAHPRQTSSVCMSQLRANGETLTRSSLMHPVLVAERE